MRSNVRPRTRCLPRAACALLVAATLAGCGSPSSNEPADAPSGGRFGADYEILVEVAEAAPEQPPALRGDTLTATVAYPGGGTTHDFSLRHETRGDTVRLWLRHDAAGEDDSTRILDEVRVRVPQAALDASTVVLLSPQGNAPFVLQWPGASSAAPHPWPPSACPGLDQAQSVAAARWPSPPAWSLSDQS